MVVGINSENIGTATNIDILDVKRRAPVIAGADLNTVEVGYETVVSSDNQFAHLGAKVKDRGIVDLGDGETAGGQGDTQTGVADLPGGGIGCIGEVVELNCAQHLLEFGLGATGWLAECEDAG